MPPTEKEIEQLLKKFQRGFPDTKAGMIKAHDVFADAYGTMGWMLERIKELESNQNSSPKYEKSVPSKVKQVVQEMERRLKENEAKEGWYYVPVSGESMRVIVPVLREWLDWNE